jgi:transcriptional regulator with XRE-family HTH domain
MGVDSETISRIERGHVVRLDRLYDLAVLYDIPVASLFHDAPGPRPDRIDEIVLVLGLLDETNRQWVLEMVRAVTAKLERPA